MRSIAFTLIGLLLAGCASSRLSYLGVPEDERRTIEQENPEIDSRLHGMTTVSKVQTVDYTRYIELKCDRGVDARELHGRFVYFSVQDNRHVPFGPSPSEGAYVDVTGRYRARLPDRFRSIRGNTIEDKDTLDFEDYRWEQSLRMSPTVEKELENLQVDHEDLSSVVREILSPTIDISGSWTTHFGYSGSTLEISGSKTNGYFVHFQTGGCIGDWDLKRSGTYSNGVLRLNKAVQDYDHHPDYPAIYDTIYAVSVGRKAHLIPQSELRPLAEHHATNGVIGWSKDITRSFFRPPEQNETQ